MSKAVKSVGRAVSKVVQGVVNVVKVVTKPVVEAAKAVVKPVAEAIKKVTSSKIGRIILAAAAIYFGGAALAGGLGSSAAGGSFLSGMGTGVANAASGLSSAWTSALSGNFTGAGGVTANLSAGFQGTTTALQAANVGAMTSGMTQAQMLASQNAGIPGATAATNSAAATAFPASTAGAGGASQLALTPSQVAGSKGLIGSLSPMGQYAAISGATQLVGGAVQGYGAQKAQEDERNYAEQQLAAQRARYESSVQDFSKSANAQRDAAQATENRYAPAAFDPVAEARAIGDRYRAEFDARNPTTGLVARGMQFQQPTTNNNFPVYNPYYFRG
jgi:hypothetical protein